MIKTLPADLLAAENMVLEALQTSLKDQPLGRWEVNLKFEGLKLMPVALRLMQNLQEDGFEIVLVWPDMGGAALAKHNAPELANQISSINDLLGDLNGKDDDRIFLVVAPQPSDYEQFELLCNKHSGAVVMLNGRLEDSAVGIGGVARQRRRGFLSLWRKAYWLEPLESGALMRSHPGEWILFRADVDGYRETTTFDQRPDAEAIDLSLIHI